MNTIRTCTIMAAVTLLSTGLRAAAAEAGLRGGGVANVVTMSATKAMKVSELGLREAGLAGAEHFPDADEIRVFESADKMNESPKARIWLDARSGQFRFHTGGEGVADDFEIRFGNAVVILTTGSKADIVWANPFEQN